MTEANRTVAFLVHYLVGHSFGSKVGFELARRLESDGSVVELTMLDAGIAASALQEPAGGLAELMLPKAVFDSLNASGKVDPVALLGKAIELGMVSDEVSQAQFDVFCRAADEQLKLSYRYQPTGQFAGQVTLIQAAEGLVISPYRQEIVEHLEQWCELPVVVLAVGGDHRSIVKEVGLFALLG